MSLRDMVSRKNIVNSGDAVITLVPTGHVILCVFICPVSVLTVKSLHKKQRKLGKLRTPITIGGFCPYPVCYRGLSFLVAAMQR